MARTDFGNNLINPGLRQPTGNLTIDAYGLAQAQLTFAVDSSVMNLTDVIDTYEMGVPYPDDLGFTMMSYKCHITLEKAGVAMLTVDYIGVSRGIGYTDAQITGVANTQAQPIETHPNFTVITAPAISSNILAGSPTGTRYNQAIFNQIPQTPPNPPQFNFAGFGVGSGSSPNPKAGVRQYLRPMVNIRGQIFFDYNNLARAKAIAGAVGWLVPSDSDLQKMVTPLIPPVNGYKKALITSANLEGIGTPDPVHLPVMKVTYDLLIANDSLGWDTDIYGVWPTSFFS